MADGTLREYPKAFEEWYSRHDNWYYKRSLFNAWKAGRRHQKKLAYACGGIVRWRT